MKSNSVASNLSSTADIPVVILSGGKGIFVDDSGVRKSKGEVDVAGVPLLAHVIKIYLESGFRKFIVSGGYRIENQLQKLTHSFSLKEISARNFAGRNKETDFEVQFVDSGDNSLTGDRLLKLQDLLVDCPRFCMTYSDTISTVNIKQIYNWHLKNKKTVTLMAVKLPTRFRVLGIRSGESLIRGFADKTFMPSHLINGGFYIVESSIWSYFKTATAPIIFEKNILEQLLEKNELESFAFSGAWQYIDSERDLNSLVNLVNEISSMKSIQQ